MPISDIKLAKMAQEYSQLRERAKGLEARAEKRKAAILTELERRGVKAIETDEVRVTRVQKSNVRYDEGALKEKLGRKFVSISTRHIDKDKLAAAVQDGRVDLEVVDECSEVTYNRPYIVVSSRGTDA